MKKHLMTKIYMAFLLVAVLLTACQPTPTREAVVNAGNLESEIASSSVSVGIYDVPNSWQETLDIEGSNAKIEIDAKITLPDVTAFPVYKVSKADFTTEQAQMLVGYFTKGKDVIKNKERTKAELEQDLVYAKKDNDEQWMTQLEEMIETAPVTIPDEIITDWNPTKSPDGSFLDEAGEQVGISVRPEHFLCMNGSVIPESMLLTIESEDPAVQHEKVEIGGVSISETDAIAAAQNRLHELGIDYMTADSLEKALLCRSLFDVYTDSDEKPISKGYNIRFVRNVDGISGVSNDAIIFYLNDDFAYRAPLCPEDIQIYVDEAGEPQSFIWQYPLVIDEKTNDNVELIPFEDMKQRIRDMLTFISAREKEQKTVDRIELHMTIVDVRDRPDEAVYVPAWFVYYSKTVDIMTDGSSWEQNYKLVLNAVDGGRVLEAPVDFGPEMQQAINQQNAQYGNKQ